MLYNSLVKGEEMRKIKQKNNFAKKNYRHFLVSEIKKEFGNDAKKYIEWELGVLETGLKMTGNIEMLNILNKYRSNLIETILSKDNEIVQNVMASTLGDYREMEKNSN